MCTQMNGSVFLRHEEPTKKTPTLQSVWLVSIGRAFVGLELEASIIRVRYSLLW